MVTTNLGRTDRVLRFLLAFWWLGPWAPSYSYPAINVILFVLGWIALAESIIGFCWLQHLLGIRTKE
ncbi:DUF2892 domain-containing protein [Candidatus Woesearchaeota archaeon]|nr:DUF2892 domain-containing protein [Candidatus Woesearchaeota archaeon]